MKALDDVFGEETGHRIQHAPLWKAVVNQLRILILSGELGAGTHLVETDLAQMLGVSRGPIRQALAQLEQEGFVEILPRQGAFVLEITPELVHEKYELRRLLEEYAVRRAVSRLRPHVLKQLAAHCDEMERAVRTQDLEGFFMSQYLYHRAVVAAAGMPSLLRLWELVGLGTGSLMLLNLYYANPEPFSARAWQSLTAESSITGHRQLLGVIAQADPDLAVTRMREHLNQGESAVLKSLASAQRVWQARRTANAQRSGK
ncbi:MAG: GntR family transcriptional regulator [Chloroflexi bacterium]|nr:GntR family transcriptional regulator [Chloroflexota bacterium]